VVAHVRILLEQDDAAARHDGALALVGIDQARQALQERRLARAIAADQRKPVARTDMDVEVAEQPAFALDEPEVFIGECRRSHAAPLASPLHKGNRCGWRVTSVNADFTAVCRA
jgi:hypothetical protein